MDYRPESIAETARHIAAKTAEPLSCEVGAVLVRHGDDLVAEVITRDWPARLDRHEIRRTLVDLFERAEHGPVVEREISAQAGDALGREQGLVARYALPIGRPAFGVLVVAHASTHARGFTNLCQRIGHALAEAAETLLVQAMSREGLAADRDRFAREARIDPLTGLENRAAWEELLAVETARLERHSHAVSVVSADLDNLKAVNDQAGHATGDRLIRAAADLLRRCSRGADRIARVGGDEFLVLLPDTDAKGAAAFMARVDEELPGLRVDGDTPVALSLGTATARLGEPLADVVCRADQAMYSAKRQRLEPAS
ncbi:MAG: GGDEF domain-containing protein [Candidatus Dormibacteraeota bacterium]|nr:GGDEF domain-containing protein [Candidatus Dormibacteraeota bacterium]